MFVHSYTVLNDEENVNASERQEPFEHGVVLLQEALGVRGVRVAVPVGAPVLVHVALPVVVAVVVASVGLPGETTGTPLGQPGHCSGTGPQKVTRNPTAPWLTLTYCAMSVFQQTIHYPIFFFFEGVDNVASAFLSRCQR